MNLQVVVATMNQNDYSLLQRMHIDSDIVIANQCDRTEYGQKQFNGHIAKMISTDTKGVGINRNIGLMYANADIILFADDDIVYQKGYEEKIIREFGKHLEADGIFFRFEYVKNGEIYYTDSKKKGRKKGGIHNVLKYGTYNLAIKRQFLQQNNITFSALFGGGSIYGSGEDSLLILDLLRKGGKLYISNLLIGRNCKDKSSWFSGYNRKYFFDNGAFIQCAFPHMGWLIRWYYVFRFMKLSEINTIERARCLKEGGRAFQTLGRYDDETFDSFK